MSPVRNQDTRILVYDRDAVTYRGSLAGLGLSWSDVYGDEAGEASVTAKFLESALAADPNLLREAVCKVSVDLTDTGSYTDVFSFLVSPGAGTVIGDQEAAAKELTPVGRGQLWLFNDFLIMAEQWRDGLSENRYFGWMSGWYDDSSWGSAQGVTWAGDPTARNGSPEIFSWMDPSAQWIAFSNPATTVLPKTVHCLRKSFTLTERKQVRIYHTADNYLMLWLNGELISDMREDLYNWKGAAEWDAILDPGTYTLAARLSNASVTTGGNPVAFLCSVQELDSNGNPVGTLLHTNTSWKAFDGTTAEPGLTVGQIVRRLRQEAAARGIPAAQRMVLDFTDTTDSRGDAWGHLENRVWRIGSPAMQAITDLGEMVADFDMGSTQHLKAYNEQGVDRSGTVVFAPGTVARNAGENLKNYAWTGTPLQATRALVQTQDGFLEVRDGDAEDVYEARETFLEAGTSITRKQGRDVAKAALWDQGMSRERYSFTAVIYAVPGCTPYVDFGKGDQVMALSTTGAQKKLQVVSIAGSRPDDGGPIQWTVELEEIQPAPTIVTTYLT